MLSSTPNRQQAVRAILERACIPIGISGWAASCLVPGQPFHRLALWGLRQAPMAAVVILLQMVLVGLLTADCLLLLHAAWDRLPESANQTHLLGPVAQGAMGWVRSLGDLPHGRLTPIGVVVFGLPVWLALLNLSWVLVCRWVGGVGDSFSLGQRWWWTAGLGLVPLRLLSASFLRPWAFWREDVRRIRAVEARIVQFSAIYAWANGLGRDEVEARWVVALDHQVREIADSFFSFLYVPGWISLGGSIMLGMALYLQMGWLFPVRLEWIAVAWMVYLALNRGLLGVATFCWLSSPAMADEVPEGQWSVRAVGMVLCCMVVTAGVAAVVSFP